MSKKIIQHFKKVDPVLHRVIIRLNDSTIFNLEKSSDYFASLCREIVGQQLSGKAADTIYARFEALFPKKKIVPETVLKIKDQRLRDAGMSWSKVSFIKNLAQKVKNNKLDLSKIDEMDNATVIQILLEVKGIGPWTAEMFLMFALAREDVYSHGDLGLKKGFMKIYNLKKLPSPKQLEKITKKWSPYRTYACRILWRSLEI